MRFCPQCGSKLYPNARFCVECGEQLAASRSGQASSKDVKADASRPAPAASPSLGPFVAVLSALIVFGIVIAYLVMRQLPERDRLLASAPAVQSASAAPQENGQLPANHPPVKLPKDALDFIAQVESKAHANPHDLDAWNKLGDVTLRAAVFDPKYYQTATEAYSHVLKIDPDNLGALRGIGNLDFDQHKYDAAIAAYEHYLSRKPDDPDVRTDLATMYLSSNAGDQAIQQYKRVLEAHPNFFEATFNLGVAYSQMGNPADARTYFQKALKLAPDDQARGRVNQMLASLNSPNSVPDMGGGPPPPNTAGQPADFRGQVEQVMRDLPIAGNKVQAIEWTSDTKARVIMDNFPMDQMPPFAAAKFVADLKSGIEQAKTAHHITTPVQIDICDSSSGRIMKTVTE
jgi:tetratricopeptide (TPR) repeat protein